MDQQKIGKGMYDKKAHLLVLRGYVWQRLCCSQPVNFPPEAIDADEITCENCQIAQHWPEW